MARSGIGTNVMCQVAIVVGDIDQAVRMYADIFGVEVSGPVTTGPQEETNIRYRGQPTPGRAKLSFLQMGSQLSVELIEPIGGPSTWQEQLDKHGPGVHHIAFQIESMDRVLDYLTAKGIATVQRGDYKGGRYAYADSRQSLGVVLELLESIKV